MKKNRKNEKGMALVEIVVGSAIIAVGILAIISSYGMYVNYSLSEQKSAQVSYLQEEGLEVVALMRDGGWTKNIAPLTPHTIYYLVFTAGNWATSTTPQYVDGQFLRWFTVSSVSRNSDYVIMAGGGTDDPNTKIVTVGVSYLKGHSTTTESMSEYITNINND